MTDVSVEKKRQHELDTVSLMINIYCRGKHHTTKGLCPSCQELADYVSQRTKHCPHMADKTFCSACKTHCYAPKKRQQIQAVMRYSGPRMLFHAPRPAIYHLYIQLKSKLTHS